LIVGNDAGCRPRVPPAVPTRHKAGMAAEAAAVAAAIACGPSQPMATWATTHACID